MPLPRTRPDGPSRHPLTLCDDICDAATEAIEAVNARIRRLGLELAPESFEALRLAEAQEVAEEVEGETGICPGCSARLLPDPLDLLCRACEAEEYAEARPLEELF